MTIPDRLKLKPVDNALVAQMMDLCESIEDELESGEDAALLLQEWHRHAQRQCVPHEFQAYWKSISTKEFVLEALNPVPSYNEDIEYSEVIAILETVNQAAASESEIDYYLNWLEAQFPNSNMSDLIFWPDEWFGDASLFRDAGGAFKPEASLSADQIIGYAMTKSGRHLNGAPAHIELPFPIPPEK